MKVKRHNWLINMINEKGYTIGAEIGAATGVTTKHLLANCPDLKQLLIVDIWKPVGPSGHPWNRDDMEEVFRNRFGSDPRIRILKGLSWEMATDVDDRSLDFAFIDADHSYECVKKDILAWSKKLKAAGVLCGHDIESEGVFKAVDKLLPGWKNSGIDQVWYYADKDIKANPVNLIHNAINKKIMS